MSFSSFLRRAFGSEESEVAEEFDDLDRPAVAVDAPQQSIAPAEPAAAASIPEALADAILAVINSQFPPALAACVDPEAQRRWLEAQMGPALAVYVGEVNNGAMRELTGDKARIQSELEELRAERKEVAGRREEQKAALLSEQRQRRALADRNRDLESKINELDSEIEQHKLTISSLMNKMRVAEVSEADVESQAAAEADRLRVEVESLRSRLAEQDKRLADAAEVIARADEVFADKDREIASLVEKVAELESASALQQALDDRRKNSPADDAAEPSETPRRRRGRPRKQQLPPPDAASDSSADLEEIDWLLPGGVPAGHTGHVADPEFGYQPPKQTPAPDSDAQLTLF